MFGETATQSTPIGYALLGCWVMAHATAPLWMSAKVREKLMSAWYVWTAYRWGAVVMGIAMLCCQGSLIVTCLITPIAFGFGLVPEGQSPLVHFSLFLHHMAPVMYMLIVPAQYISLNSFFFFMIWICHSFGKDPTESTIKLYLTCMVITMGVWWHQA
eukprot:gene22882-9278_t